MSHPVEIKNTALDLTLMTERWIGATDPSVLLLHQFLLEWGAMGEMSEITFTQDGGNPLLYAWRAERKNLRVLDSTFLFADDLDIDPELTISLVQSWPKSVIEKGGGTRNQLIAIRALVGIESFSVVFS